MPPDRRPAQRVLDWLIDAAPSAYVPPDIAARVHMPEDETRLVLVALASDGFIVKEAQCYRAFHDDDPDDF